jgi:predicted DNA-binding transcriptional regulator AlpA
MNDLLLDKRAVCSMLGGIHPSTLWRLVKAGRFPKPIRVSVQLRRWSRSECEAALELLKGARHG